MDIFNIQALIAEGRVVNSSDIDPTNTYAQVGVYQQNGSNRSSNANNYKSYAISLSEIGGKVKDFKNYIVVDMVYGNDSNAILDIYNEMLPFSTIDNAIINASPGDLIIVNKGVYTIGVNIASKDLSFYFRENVNIIIMK